MFFDLKRVYDNSTKDIELECRDYESKILEKHFNLELMKNNSIITDKEKDQFKFKFTLKYNKEDFLPTTKPFLTEKSHDIPIDNSEGEQIK